MAPVGAVALVLAMAQPSSATTDSIDWVEPDRQALERTEVSLDRAGIVDPREEIEIFIRLDEPAVTEFVAEQVQRGRGEPSADARRSHAQRVEQQHDRLRSELARLGVSEQSSLKVGANGLRVRAPIQDMAKLADLPGVMSVAPVTLHEPANDTSVPWIGAPEAWDSLGFTGEGITISVIDTGIDYTHASFEGSGEVADYEFIAQDTTVIPEVGGEPVFPTAKVVDGFDFVGVDYDAGGTPEQQIPEPDPNPLDVHGHGSHVAGTAAGVEVLDADDDVRVGSGVAPGAQLYAAKVFGDVAGSTAVTADAIEWSLDPRGDGSMEGQAHVINMSLGNVFGNPGDPSAIAAQNATELGTVVVASAGNEGPASYVTGSPAVAPGAISVAASIDGGYSVLGLQVHEPAEVEGLYEAAESAISVPLEETGPVTEELAIVEPLIACEEDGDGELVPRVDNPEEVAGNIALVQRGLCPFSTKHLAVQEAGAVGILVFNSEPGDPIVMGGDSAGIEIPGMMISLADGELLLAQLDAGETVSVTMSADIVIPKPELADTLADFTSAGPSRAGSGFKPDVAAPGFSIDSAAVGSGAASASSSGTSMAAPHVAGLAALMAHQHGLPGIGDVDEKAATVSAIKSLIMNTTRPAEGDYPLTRQGTGIVQADRAVTADAYTAPAGLSFGRVNPLEPTSVTETVTVTNLADADRTFGVSFAANQAVPGVTVTHDETVTVAAGATATVDVTLSLDPAAMPPDGGSFSQTEVDGWLVLDDGTTSLRSGLMAVVDPAAAVQVDSVPRAVLDPTIELAVSNPSQTVGASSGLTLTGVGDDADGVIEAVGVRTGEISGIEVVEFGLATDAWESLSTRETEILLDVDSEAGFDYALVAADLGVLQNADPTGTVVTGLFDLETGAGTLQWFVDADYHDQVQVLTVDRFAPLGFLEPGVTEFDYLAMHLEGDTVLGMQEGSVDLSDNVDDRLNPSLSVPAGAEGTVEFPVEDQRDMLWLHPNNAVGAQFQVTPLDAAVCDQTISGLHLGPLTVTDGVTCLVDATVIGPVTVRSDAGLAASGSRVIGPVSAKGAAILELDDTRVTGPVTARGVDGSVLLTGNHVVGPMTVKGNSTGDNPIVVSGNRIIGPLSCSGNQPPPTDNGDPNVVTGPKTGQCADL